MAKFFRTGSIFLTLIVLLGLLCILYSKPVNEECEKRVPASYTAPQKAQLCSSKDISKLPPPGYIGPAICATLAKQLMHGLKFESVLQLCQDAVSAAPIHCMAKMDNTNNKQKAVDLCAGARSSLPGECYHEIHDMGSNKINAEAMTKFCKGLHDRSPLLCLKAVKSTNLLPISQQSLDLCKDSIGNSGSSNPDHVEKVAISSGYNAAVSNCIKSMHSELKPSFGVTAEAILKFCIESNPAAYEQAIHKGEEPKEDEPPQDMDDSPPAECYRYSAKLSSTPTNNENFFEKLAQEALKKETLEAEDQEVDDYEDFDFDEESGERRERKRPPKPVVTAPPFSAMLNPKQRLQLCANAPNARAPIECAIRSAIKGGMKAGDLSLLCAGATTAGPADCFNELTRTFSSGTKVEERIELCNGASGPGPALCYRRSANLNFKPMSNGGPVVPPALQLQYATKNRTLLCLAAASEDPAMCAQNAPHYLSAHEKVDLCTHTPPQKAQDPVKCLAAIESHSKLLKHGPKKALGYFLENLWDAQERKSRALAIALCSFANSQDPLASAECFKSAPVTLEFDHAARMRTDIASIEFVQHMQLCHRLLDPTGKSAWSSEESALLCESTTSREQVENVVKCATETLKIPFPKLSRPQVAQLCAAETKKGNVLSCLREVGKGASASSPSSYLLTPEVLLGTCGAPVSTESKPKTSTSITPGACLVRLAGLSSSKTVLDGAVPAYLCGLADPLGALQCIDKLPKRMLSLDDVMQSCVDIKPEVRTMRVKRILTEDHGIEITAGRRFSVWFEVIDQFGRKFRDPKQHYLFSAGININNPQGAILWGMRTNYTYTHDHAAQLGRAHQQKAEFDGLLMLDNIVISQPGPIELKISVLEKGADGTFASTSRGSSGSGSEGPKVVELFNIHVQPDPTQTLPTYTCLFVFHQALCPAYSNTAAEWDEEFPRIRSYSAGSNYLGNIECANETLAGWHVNGYLMADGSMWSEYRLGIDAIWTGVGMPRMEQSAEERLGLVYDSEALKGKSRGKRDADGNTKSDRQRNKEIRRAYYKKSLQWHPDRWSGLNMYSPAVQSAFELINEAYSELTNGSEK